MHSFYYTGMLVILGQIFISLVYWFYIEVIANALPTQKHLFPGNWHRIDCSVWDVVVAQFALKDPVVEFLMDQLQPASVFSV